MPIVRSGSYEEAEAAPEPAGDLAEEAAGPAGALRPAPKRAEAAAPGDVSGG